jgi:hypothetical protein
MNPDYLKVIARPFGGPKRLKAQYLKQMKEMGQNGVTFQAAITRRADIAFEVDYGFEDLLVDGKKVMGEDGSPRKWHAIVSGWSLFRPSKISSISTNRKSLPNFAVFESGNMKSRFLQRAKRVGLS